MDLLFWIYLVNAIVLIVHEIDSGYWEEWNLISSKEVNGINGFLIAHFPLLFIVLIGLVLVYADKPVGYACSFLVAAGGIFAFVFHGYHLRKGRQEFNTPLSKGLIGATFILSITQLIITIVDCMH